MHVSKWRNSPAIRLPAAAVEVLGLKEGDDIEIHVAGVRAFEIAKTPGSRELLVRLIPIQSAKETSYPREAALWLDSSSRFQPATPDSIRAEPK